MKKIAIIPTLLTLGNAVCGFAAIGFASKIDGTPATDINFAYSAWLILAAMLFDAFDGFAARLSKSSSEFGGQLDSLSDAISFGAAPAFLLWRTCQDWEAPLVRQALAVIAAFYMVCTILRLARFNIENSPDPASHKRFKGLPSPAAAGCLASLAILRGGFIYGWAASYPVTVRDCVRLWAPVGALLVALLMISRLPYPHLTKQLLRGRRHFSYLLRIVLAIFLIALTGELALVVLFWGYALTIASRYAMIRLLRDHTLPTPAPGLDDGLPH